MIEHGGRWLLIRNTYGRGHWTFPGGAVDRGEPASAAAIREVKEEVGIVLPSVRPIGEFFTDKEYKRDTVYCFTASVASPFFETDGAEIAEAAWFEPDRLPDFRGPAVDRIVAMLSTPERSGGAEG